MTTKYRTKANTSVSRTKRIGIVGIKREWSNPNTIDFSKLYEGIGKNTGNLMFTEAVHTVLRGEISSIGFNFSPDWINENFDAVVIPAANWLNDYADWDWLTDKLQELKVPTIIIGIGIQATSLDLTKVQVNQSCMRLIDFFANKPIPISVRGEFTRSWLKSNGINNVIATGCPSIYMNIFSQDRTSGCTKPVFQSTRYALSDAFLRSTGVNKRIFEFSTEFDCPLVYQSEPEEMQIITQGAGADVVSAETLEMLLDLYGFSSIPELEQFLNRNGKVFYDLQSWSQFLRNKASAVIGTRLHGAILALNSGVPALLVPHDSRTAEVATFAGIQSINGQKIIQHKDLETLMSELSKENLERYRDTRSRNAEIFRNFLVDSGLELNAEGVH